MVWLNKVVWYMLMPMTIGCLLVSIGLVLSWSRKRRAAMVALLGALLWFWVWGTQAFYRVLGGMLENPYPPQRVETMPAADAIVVLGGGMGCNTNLPYAEMWSAGDRVWHASRLYKAGKATVVIPSGSCEEYAAVPLLMDLGVPRKAIRVESQARNTEENARLVEKLVRGLPGIQKKRIPRVLLVTSAWHMRRSLLNFEKTGLEVIPAATDHEAMENNGRPLRWFHFFPTHEYLDRNTRMMKEFWGYWLYRGKYLLRPLSGRNDEGKKGE